MIQNRIIEQIRSPFSEFFIYSQITSNIIKYIMLIYAMYRLPRMPQSSDPFRAFDTACGPIAKFPESWRGYLFKGRFASYAMDEAQWIAQAERTMQRAMPPARRGPKAKERD